MKLNIGICFMSYCALLILCILSSGTYAAIASTAYPAGYGLPTQDLSSTAKLTAWDDFLANTWPSNMFSQKASTASTAPDGATITATGSGTPFATGQLAVVAAEAGTAVANLVKSKTTYNIGTYGVRIVSRSQGAVGSVQLTQYANAYAGFLESSGGNPRTFFSYLAVESAAATPALIEAYGYLDPSLASPPNLVQNTHTFFAASDNTGGAAASNTGIISMVDILPTNITWSVYDGANKNPQSNGWYSTKVLSLNSITPTAAGSVVIGANAGVKATTAIGTATINVDWIALYTFSAPPTTAAGAAGSGTSGAMNLNFSFSLLSFILSSLSFMFYLRH